MSNVSYRGVVNAKRLRESDHMPLLLGGALSVWSSRFETREQAERWVETMMKGQPCHCEGKVKRVRAPPEIPADETFEVTP